MQLSRSLILACASFTAALLFGRVAASETYRNAEFGFSVEVPDGAPTCRAEPPEHDHGLDIFLDDGSDGCDELLKRPFVGILGNYNAMFDPSPEVRVERLCGAKDGQLTPPPDGLGIEGRHSASCQLERRNGRIEIIVVAQGAKPFEADPSSPETSARINYDFSLWTRQERYLADLAQFRQILSNVRLFDPE